MVGWIGAPPPEQCSSTAKRPGTDTAVDIIVSDGLQLQISRNVADRSQLLQSGFELASVDPFVCPIEVSAFQAWLNMADAQQMDIQESINLLKVADFLIDKFAVDKLCLHLARELFDGTSVMNEHRIPDGPMFADGNIMDIIKAIPEHLLVSIISCAHSLEAVFAGLPVPYHLLALCSYCPDINATGNLDISSETLQATRCALEAAEGRLSLSAFHTQVFSHPAAGWAALGRFITPLSDLACLEVTSQDPSNAHFAPFCASLPTTLRRLRLTGAPLFNPTLVVSLQRTLSRLHCLCELSLTHGSLTPDTARILAECMYASLRHCLLPALSSVSLAHNEIGQSGWEAIAPALATLPALRLLNLDAASRTSSLRPMVTRECPLSAFATLHYLDISNTFEDDPVWDGVADPYGTVGAIQWLPKNSWLSGLKQFRATGVSKGRFLGFLVPRLATAAKCMHCVDLSTSPLPPVLVRALANGLASWQYLHSLELRACGLTAEAAALIAPVLTSLEWLQVLDLSGNPLGPEGVAAVLAALAATATAAVQTLRLGGTACACDTGAAALAALLAHGATRGLRQLQSLSLPGIGMAAAAAAVLAPQLAALPSLTCLDAAANPLGEVGIARLLQEFANSGSPLQEVNVRDTGVPETARAAAASRAPASAVILWG